MKLDGEWITRMAARVEGAEEALTGSGVFTHRSCMAISSRAAAAGCSPVTYSVEPFDSAVMHEGDTAMKRLKQAQKGA